MRGGKSVFQAVRAARVFRHVSANAADTLRRGIGRVEKAMGRNPSGHFQVDHARLYRHPCVRQVHFEDTVHTCQADHYSVLDWQGASAQSRA